MSDNFKIRIKGERDIIPIIRFMLMFILFDGILLLLIPFTYKNLFISSICSMILCILSAYIIHKLSEGMGALLSEGASRRTSRDERFSCEINKIKYSKREGRFDQALQLVNGLLDQDTDIPEALLLKAQILWEGHGKADAAGKCLNRIRELTPENDKFHRWAMGYLKKVGAKAEKD